MCNTSFGAILTGHSVFEIILIIQGHFLGKEVNFKVKQEKISFLAKKLGMCVIRS